METVLPPVLGWFYRCSPDPNRVSGARLRRPSWEYGMPTDYGIQSEVASNRLRRRRIGTCVCEPPRRVRPRV